MGSRVTVQLESGGVKTYVLGDSQTADPAKGVISVESPLGKALFGVKAGEKKAYTVDKREIKIEVQEIV